MCGIAGYIGKKKIETSVLHRTLSIMKNRGPDHQDYRYIEKNGIRIYLIHSRLSIIDLEKRSNQPYTLDDCTLIFNGEIYNYIELRGELKKQGIECITTSDTEVLLRYYLSHGEDCVKYFEGMWSFAIYDSRTNILFLSRDRFAEKPLYYYQSEDGLYFGSEVKFIKSLSSKTLTINQKHLLRYLVNGYKSLFKVDETFFKEIREVPYATNLIINHDLSARTIRYWNLSSTPKKMTLDEAIQGFREILLESIKIRLRADVPLAFCLSGGVDSAAIVSIAAKYSNYDVSTFSIVDSDERYNELDNIQATLSDLECKNTIIHIPTDRFHERLTDLIKYHDAPVYTISYYIHSLLSESISQQGYKVVCSGTGADELVTGYYDHYNLYLYEMRNHPEYEKFLNDWNENTGKMVRNPYLQNPELYFDDPGFRDFVYLNNEVFAGFLKVEFNECFTESYFCDNLLRNRMMNELFHEAVPVILHEDDKNSMMYSVENRSPYLDSKLCGFAYSIPVEYLIRDGYGKYILREAVKGILNDKVRLDRRKIGFNASIHSLIDFKRKENRDLLLDGGLVYDYVKKEKVEEVLLMDPMPNSYSKFLFNFINVKIFLEGN